MGIACFHCRCCLTHIDDERLASLGVGLSIIAPSPVPFVDVGLERCVANNFPLQAVLFCIMGMAHIVPFEETVCMPTIIGHVFDLPEHPQLR